MKILLQIGIIFGIFWLSQGLELLLPFPASVIGLILLLVLLCVRAIRAEQIGETANFILGNLAFFFVPITVSIINYVDLLLENGTAFLVICVVSTVATFAATAWAVQLTARLLAKRKEAAK